MRTPKICHVTSVHPRDDVRIFRKMCMSLASAGADVTLLVADGRCDEEISGIAVADVGMRPRSRILRFLFSSTIVLVACLKRRGTIFHIHDPELLPAAAILRLSGRVVIYDAHEHLRFDIDDKKWIPAVIRKPLGWGVDIVEKTLALMMSRVVAATPSIAERFAPSCFVVRNFPLVAEFPLRKERVEESGWQVAYVGGLAEIRGIREIVDCAAEMEAERVSFVVAGHFMSPEFEAEMKAKASGNLRFTGSLNRDEISELLAASDVGLVTLHPTQNYLYSYPVKLFEYMAASLPVIASDFSVWRELIEDEQCGVFVDPMDTGAIADAIRSMRDHPAEARGMGTRGRNAVETKYSWERESERLLSVYRELGVCFREV